MKLSFLLGACFAPIFMSGVCLADDCPAAVSGRGAFMVERSEELKTEILFGDGHLIRLVSRRRGQTFLEAENYEGLIELVRVDKGRRTVFTPQTDLDKVFPLKPKQKISIDLEAMEDGGKPYLTRIGLSVVGADKFPIGACTYDILKLERAETRSGKNRETYVEYYAPELRFVVAKEYKERNGRTTIVKYDRIYATDR